MTNTQIVESYLDAMFGGCNDFDAARALLADDLRYEGPMLKAADADDFIGQMRELGRQFGAMKATIRHLIADGNLVAALYEFHGPQPALFAEWFTVEAGRIAGISIVHDTRPYASPSR